MNTKIANIIATYFGLGLSKFAPGTVGSLGTIPLVYILIYFGGFWALFISIPVIFFIGAKATKVVASQSGDDDPSKVVIDETAGMLTTFSLVTFLAPEVLLGSNSWIYYIAGFALFRFFDILKMGPVKYADTKIKNAYGVMLDDIFAGIFASILLLCLLFFMVNK